MKIVQPRPFEGRPRKFRGSLQTAPSGVAEPNSWHRANAFCLLLFSSSRDVRSLRGGWLPFAEAYSVFPLLVLKGIYDYWICFLLLGGLSKSLQFASWLRTKTRHPKSGFLNEGSPKGARTKLETVFGLLEGANPNHRPGANPYLPHSFLFLENLRTRENGSGSCKERWLKRMELESNPRRMCHLHLKNSWILCQDPISWRNKSAPESINGLPEEEGGGTIDWFTSRAGQARSFKI